MAWGLSAPSKMADRTSRRPLSTTSLVALWVASIALAASSAEAASCEPARAASDLSSLPLPWRTAFEALIGSTSREGLPWSCPGGTIDLSLAADEGVGILTITDPKGRKTTRRVASPGEVGPTGKALLAAPPIAAPGAADEASTAAPSAAPTIVAPPRSEAPRATPPADARLVLGISGGPRVSGPDTSAWMSGSLRGAIPFGPWAIGLWTRFDLPIAMERALSPYFSMSSVSLGLSGGRSFSLGPVALEARFAPSVAVVSMELAADETVKHPEGARVAFRLGAEVGAATRITDWLRARIALDGEVAPASSVLIADGFPRTPRYMMGLSLGLEAVIH